MFYSGLAFLQPAASCSASSGPCQHGAAGGTCSRPCINQHGAAVGGRRYGSQPCWCRACSSFVLFCFSHSALWMDGRRFALLISHSAISEVHVWLSMTPYMRLCFTGSQRCSTPAWPFSSRQARVLPPAGHVSMVPLEVPAVGHASISMVLLRLWAQMRFPALLWCRVCNSCVFLSRRSVEC